MSRYERCLRLLDFFRTFKKVPLRDLKSFDEERISTGVGISPKAPQSADWTFCLSLRRRRDFLSVVCSLSKLIAKCSKLEACCTGHVSRRSEQLSETGRHFVKINMRENGARWAHLWDLCTRSFILNHSTHGNGCTFYGMRIFSTKSTSLIFLSMLLWRSSNMQLG